MGTTVLPRTQARQVGESSCTWGLSSFDAAHPKCRWREWVKAISAGAWQRARGAGVEAQSVGECLPEHAAA